jgi:hypothetical protein
MAVEYENIEVVDWSIIIKMYGSFRGYQCQRDLKVSKFITKEPKYKE